MVDWRKRTPPGREGAANATFGIFTDIGTSLGAMVWGVVYSPANSALVFQLAAGVAVFTAVLSGLIFQRRTDPSPAQPLQKQKE